MTVSLTNHGSCPPKATAQCAGIGKVPIQNSLSPPPLRNAWEINSKKTGVSTASYSNSMRSIMMEEEHQKEQDRIKAQVKALACLKLENSGTNSSHRCGQSLCRHSTQNQRKQRQQQPSKSSRPSLRRVPSSAQSSSPSGGQKCSNRGNGRKKGNKYQMNFSKQPQQNQRTRSQRGSPSHSKFHPSKNYYSSKRSNPNNRNSHNNRQNGGIASRRTHRRRPRDQTEDYDLTLSSMSALSILPPSPSSNSSYSYFTNHHFMTMTCEEYYEATEAFDAMEKEEYNMIEDRSRYVSLDCEMVGVGPRGDRSVLARVCIVNWNYAILLDTYVKVDEPVTDYRTFVSGVRDEDLQSDKAMDYESCRAIVQNILYGKILIGHGLENDLQVLDIYHPWCDTRDTGRYAPYMTATLVGAVPPVPSAGSSTDKSISSAVPSLVNGECPSIVESDCSSTASSSDTSFTISTISSGLQQQSFTPIMQLRPRKLKELAREHLGISIQEDGSEHSPLEDAHAALGLYKLARNHWERVILSMTNQTREIEEYGDFDPSSGELKTEIENI